jgi:hypothetical protein
MSPEFLAVYPLAAIAFTGVTSLLICSVEITPPLIGITE